MFPNFNHLFQRFLSFVYVSVFIASIIKGHKKDHEDWRETFKYQMYIMYLRDQNSVNKLLCIILGPLSVTL